METLTWLDSDEQVAWRAVVEFCGRIIDGMDSDAAPFGLTGPDYEVLVHLSEAEGRGLRMSQLAARVLISRSRLTYRVDRLEERGLVVRESCVTDRRGFIARLTDDGLRLLDEVAPHHVGGVRSRLVDRLDRDEFLELGRLTAKVLGRELDLASTETETETETETDRVAEAEIDAEIEAETLAVAVVEAVASAH